MGASVNLVISTVCLILVGASAGVINKASGRHKKLPGVVGPLRGTLKTANSSGLIANADVQKEDNVTLSWAPWPCPKKGPCPAPPLCGEGGVEMQDLVTQSAEEDNVELSELSWAPWPCPKKGPWPAPPLCGEGRIEFQYDVNQSEFEQREDNVKSSSAPWPCPKEGP